MNKRILSLLLLAATSVPLIGQDGPPPNVQQLLHDLKTFSEKNASSSKSRLNQVISEVRTAANSPGTALSLYNDAMFATKFNGLTGQQSQFQEWKKKNEESLKSPAFRAAAQFHLFYLSLVLRAANGEETETLVPELINYTNQVIQAEEKDSFRRDLEKQALYRQSVASGVYAQWFGVSEALGKVKDWELIPNNVDGIYQKTILPELRKKKDPSAIRYWDSRLQRAEAKAKASSLALEIENFQQIERPKLIWSRAQEVLQLGQPNHAVNQMYSLIKEYPGHPSNGAWIKQLTDLLTPLQPAPVQGAAPAAPSTTPASEPATPPATP